MVDQNFEKRSTFKNNQKKISTQINRLLQDIFSSELRSISTSKNMKQLMSIVSLNMFDDAEYAKQIAEIDALLEKAYIVGGLYAPGGLKPIPNISKLARLNADSFITKMGEDIRTDSLSIIL